MLNGENTDDWTFAANGWPRNNLSSQNDVLKFAKLLITSNLTGTVYNGTSERLGLSVLLG